MYLNYYLEQLKYIIYMIPVLLLAITAHEFAHGWMSDKLGDPTPRREGRLSLNPFRHLDPIGTLCLLFFHMGWAKPVRINTAYYKNRKQGIILVSLAGPFMNFLIAFISLFLAGLIMKFGNTNSEFMNIAFLLCYYSTVMNTGLGVFNLIPLPPLDGSNVLEQVIPGVERFFFKIRPYSSWILVILLVSGILSVPLSRANSYVLGELWGMVSKILGFGMGVPMNTGGGNII